MIQHIDFDTRKDKKGKEILDIEKSGMAYASFLCVCCDPIAKRMKLPFVNHIIRMGVVHGTWSEYFEEGEPVYRRMECGNPGCGQVYWYRWTVNGLTLKVNYSDLKQVA